ncbi:MAG: single-stranded-DNA-specific exonuclease RecJ [Candidatus Caldatribacteriaceae bacterium]
MGKRWQIRKVDRGHLFRLAREVSLPTTMARVLMNRGVFTPSEAKAFLDPSLSLLEELKELPGLREAVVLLDQVLSRSGRILIFGDYDVDGLTGAAILFRFLRSLKARVEVYIPNRFTEGYGVTEKAAERILREHSPDLVITVDCGIRDWDGIALLRKRGVGLILTDHHLPDFQVLPEVDVLVSSFDLATRELLFPLAGAGVALALVRRYAEHRGLTTDPLEEYLGLACLGTVADAVPLLGVNRVIARYGVAALNRNLPLGIQALLEVAGLKERKIGVEEISCIIAPRLNAAGRMEDSGPALRLLLSEDWEESVKMAQYLQTLNAHRQREEEKILSEVWESERYREYLEDPIVVVSGPNWNLGVLGIIASRLAGRLNRPAVVLSETEDLAVGSGRSVAGFNLLRALEEASHLLTRYGGHEMAVGLKLLPSNIAPFRAFVNHHFGEEARRASSIQNLIVDALVDLKDVDQRLLECLKKLEPFGEQNPNPLFAVLNVSLVKHWIWGRSNQHLGFLVKQGRDVQEVVVFHGKEKASDLRESSLVDLAFEVQRDGYPYLKAHDWRIKK